jgi:formamidopyrimidine-DNA glycosylase
MPELPEVETIARKLRSGQGYPASILGRTILRADLRWKRTLATPAPKKFYDKIQGQRVEGIARRAKFLILKLSTDSLLIHLRMSGDILVHAGAYVPAPHDRLILTLSGGLTLAFNDTRKFGRAWFTDQPEEILGHLGPEPFDPALTAKKFYERLHGRRRQLKPLLLDQTFLAGLGNIYTDEALHLAKLHPLTRADRVAPDQARNLFKAIRRVLQKGIDQNGASIDWVYRGGSFQNYFRVYDRAGEACPACGAKIQRLIVGQRGTHICPQCQKRKR